MYATVLVYADVTRRGFAGSNGGLHASQRGVSGTQAKYVAPKGRLFHPEGVCSSG
jgi:hypothetical protein